MGRDTPRGRITRGTTGRNRLRRIDRWIVAHPALRLGAAPTIVDIGFGANPTTTLELAERARKVRSDALVVGVEIDPERVRAALPSERGGVRFLHGGFESPTPDGRPARIIRALNVLRQYDEAEVAEAWAAMCARLEPGGILVEGTCSELGRVASWVCLDTHGPRTLSLALRLRDLERPSVVAERLPKVLIHRNVPGERIHDLIGELDRAWSRHAPLSVYGARQRWAAVVESVRANGWPVRQAHSRTRLGELTVDWEAVAPRL